MTEYPNIINLDAAAANLSRGRFVTGTGAVPAAKAVVIGVVHEDVDAGEPVPVMVKTVAQVQAAGAITAGARVETTATGKAQAFTDGYVAGIAIDEATTDGQFIRVLLT
jgi:hypothetical protein